MAPEPHAPGAPDDRPLHPALGAPLLLLAAAHAAGAALAVLHPSAALWLIPLAPALFLPAAWRDGRPRALAVLGWLGLACGLSLWRLHAPPGSLPEHHMERPREWLELEATVLGAPYRDLRLDGSSTPWKAPLDIAAMRRLPEWQPSSGRCLAWWPEDSEEPALRPGDRVHISGVLRLADGASTGLQRSRYRLDVGEAEPRVLESSRAAPLARVVETFRDSSLRSLRLGLDDHPRERSIILALLFGVRSDMDPALDNLFSVTGTLHLFSISGLHVAMVAAILVFGLRRGGVRRDRWILWQFPALLIFVLATGAKASALRALMMAALYWGAPLVRRRPDGASALAAALILVLFLSPAQVLDIGCQFSFLVVAGMIGLAPLFAAPFRAWGAPDPWAPPGPPDLRARVTRALGRFGTGSIAPSVAAWTAGTPLTAWYFNLFSPVGLVANLVVIPAGFIIVLLGAASLLLGPLLPAAAVWVNVANAWAVAGLLHIIDLFSRLPAGWQYVMTPPLVFVVASYVLMTWIARAGRPTRAWTAACAGCAIAFTVHLTGALRFRGVDLLEADEGQAALVQSPGFAALIDAGPRSEVIQTLQSLRREGIDRLDALVLTHAAAAHIGGGDMILRQLRPRSIWVPAVLPARAPSLDALLQLAGELGIPVRRLGAGESGDWPGGLHWRVLHPEASAKPPRRASDGSLVLHLSLGVHAVLVAGGAGETAEAAVVAAGRNAACDVLVAGNDDRFGACSTALLDFTRPRQVVLSGGAHLAAFGRGDDIRGRVLERGIELLDLTLHGPVRIDLTTGRAAYVLPEPE